MLIKIYLTHKSLHHIIIPIIAPYRGNAQKTYVKPFFCLFQLTTRLSLHRYLLDLTVVLTVLYIFQIRKLYRYITIGWVLDVIHIWCTTIIGPDGSIKPNIYIYIYRV